MGSSFIVSSFVAYMYFRFGKWREKELFKKQSALRVKIDNSILNLSYDLCCIKVILWRRMRMVKEIHSKDAPAAIGPYSQAIEAGDFIYVSGQMGVDPESGEPAEGIENQ